MATNGANGNSLPALHSTAEEFLKHDYDFIICGGGTAGLVVAARLTENEDISVRIPKPEGGVQPPSLHMWSRSLWHGSIVVVGLLTLMLSVGWCSRGWPVQAGRSVGRLASYVYANVQQSGLRLDDQHGTSEYVDCCNIAMRLFCHLLSPS
jgi:hypothetical protein